jgi:hypothetical protein
VYRQEFFIVAKKDEDIESPNYHKLLALRTDRAGEITLEKDKWTDNIFLAKHFHSTHDAVDYASKQLNIDLIQKSYNYDIFKDEDTTEYRIVKVHFDIDGNSEILSILCTK